jgi:flagellar biosynthetic protein FliR
MFFAMKISAPILISILFMNVAMAVMGKAVPQINILITSLPVNFLTGFLVMFVVMPLLLWQMSELLQMTTEEVFKFIKSY